MKTLIRTLLQQDFRTFKDARDIRTEKEDFQIAADLTVFRKTQPFRILVNDDYKATVYHCASLSVNSCFELKTFVLLKDSVVMNSETHMSRLSLVDRDIEALKNDINIITVAVAPSFTRGMIATVSHANMDQDALYTDVTSELDVAVSSILRNVPSGSVLNMVDARTIVNSNINTMMTEFFSTFGRHFHGSLMHSLGFDCQLFSSFTYAEDMADESRQSSRYVSSDKKVFLQLAQIEFAHIKPANRDDINTLRFAHLIKDYIVVREKKYFAKKICLTVGIPKLVEFDIKPSKMNRIET